MGQERPATIEPAAPASAPAPAPAISDYALIGDCRSAALVSNAGSIDWLCLPHFSGPSLFAALLDPVRGGRFAITPAGAFTGERRYVAGTAILETLYRTPAGSVRVTDAMIAGSSAKNLEPRREIVRLVEGVDGAVPLDILFDPRPDYARGRFRLRPCGSHWACTWRDEILLLRSERRLSPLASGVGGRIDVAAGERICFSLSYDKGDIAVLPPLGEAGARRMRRTADWWRAWCGDCGYDGPYRDAVLRSAITLKLLTFALSGAVVAAPTASLPEWIGGERNWDYRYCWLRDAALTMRAFTGLGLQREAGAFLRWLLHATALTQPRLRVVYDVYGRDRLHESELDHLSGYCESRPVRIGNGAWDQVQHDVYGGVIAAADDFAAAGGTLQRDQLRLLAGFGETVCRIWRDPDHGIWEMRDGKRHHCFSKLMCWAALDRLLALDRSHGLGLDRQRIEAEKAAITAVIETRGYDRGIESYVGELGGDRLDASLLLMPCFGYRDPDDPRLESTFERIEQRLGRDELVYRYEPPDGDLTSPEGAFGICSFWAVENLARRGRIGEAERRLESLLGRASDLGLYAEEIDPDSGAALGNFPQAFTHVGLINAALAIGKARAS